MLTWHTWRYATYFAPRPESLLGRFGAAWLGRDAWTGESVPRPAVSGFLAEELEALTESPRRYGFHATLKPPFRLAESATVDALLGSLRAFAGAQRAFLAPPLQIEVLDGFVAFTSARPSNELNELASACVRSFDSFRAASSEAELARRMQAPLDHRQRALLRQWGYPYVHDEWKFHMSLTGSADAGTSQRVREVLEPMTADLRRDEFEIDALCLFGQRPGEQTFNLLERVALGREAA